MATRLSVLVVEDNPADLAFVRLLLEEHDGVQVRGVGSRQDAVRELHDRPYDVALVDLNLPDSQGLHTVEALAAAHPELPIVVLTGFAPPDLGIGAEAVRRGAQDFIGKDELAHTNLLRLLVYARERKRRERHALRFVDHDPRTGLPLAHVLRRRFDRAAARSLRSGRLLALVALATCRYGWLRDTYGSMLVDRVMAALGGRLRNATRKHDAVAASPPAGFLVLLEELRSPKDVDVACARLQEQCREPLTIDGVTVPVELAAGTALWTPASQPPFARLQVEAEAAMRRVLEGGVPPPAATPDHDEADSPGSSAAAGARAASGSR